MQHVAGYCLAIDYTGRNMQDAAKAKGLPWSAAKVSRLGSNSSVSTLRRSFELGRVSTPRARLASLSRKTKCKTLTSSTCGTRSVLCAKIASAFPRSCYSTLFRESAQINDVTKQSDSTGLMLYRIPQLIEHVSGIMTLEEGDVILTGSYQLARGLFPKFDPLTLRVSVFAFHRYSSRSRTSQGG